MTAHGKKITIFLIDGVPEGRLACELSNWTGKAVRIPRTRLIESADRNELHNAGVYFLFGPNPEDPSRPMVYVGESEALYNRLKDHLKQKEFWNEAVVIFSKDENLNKAHAKYLEAQLHAAALATSRYQLDNRSDPQTIRISEADQAEMGEFQANVELLLGTLGFRLFESIESGYDAAQNLPRDALYCSGIRGAQAVGRLSDEGFVVLKGSSLASAVTASFADWSANLRDLIIDNGVAIRRSDGSYELAENYLFASPSAAASVVLGRSSNGRTEWKNEAGQTLADLEDAEAD